MTATEPTPFPYEDAEHQLPPHGTITDRPPVRRPIHDGPGDPAARALTVTLFLTGMIGVLFGAAGDYAVTYACLAVSIAATATAAALRAVRS